MAEIARTESEINDVLNKCCEADENGSVYPGMSYEDGVKAGIEWVTGDTDEPPFED